MVEMVKVRFKGSAPSLVMMPGFRGKIQPGEEAQTTKQNYENELKTHTDWELIREKKEKAVKEDKSID